MSVINEKQAFSLFDTALETGFPMRPRDILVNVPAAKASQFMRSYVRQGRASYETWGNQDWLVPHAPRLDVEQFHFIQSPRHLSALGYAHSHRIFTQKDLFAAIAGDRPVDAEARKTAARLWHLDLVEQRSESGGEKYFGITPKGRKLFEVAKEYHVPQFEDRGDRADLSKFHAVLDLEAVRNP
ncbi:hypothetical protein [Rhizobium sp. BK176]|uniref:hypothetical protein n=1 Tax=Rhizobium sp. BK176 TaxID=2587071 RepID=UPI002167890C|nr:hypothetical protein [Rhizobium sp. BK176]MCS4090078.1 hypothetical protein [Rhizobium sp. BK176]